ncbi:MAG: hypothetical protein ACRC0G_07690 [Fusobacteriaceae bacterium]
MAVSNQTKKSSGSTMGGGLVSAIKKLIPPTYDQYKYFVESLVYEGKDKKKITIEKENISEVIIERDFEYDVMPFLIIKGAVQDITAVKIAMGLPEGTMHLKITKAVPNFSNKNLHSYPSAKPAQKQYINKKVCIEESFQIFMDDKSIKMYEKFAGRVTADSPPSSALKTKADHDNEEPINVALIKKEHITKPKKIINCVIPAGASISSMVGLGLSRAGVSNVLMSPPDNKAGNQSTILVPPMTLLDYLDFVNQTRGIYNTKYRFFQDFKRSYFLDSSGKCTAYEKKEPKVINIFITSFGQEGSKTYGSRVVNKTTDTGESNSAGEEYSLTIPQNSVKITTNSAFNKENKFSSILSANFRGNTESKSEIGGVPGYDNTIIKNNVYANEFIVKSEAYAASENTCIIRLNLIDVDMDIFTPNKEYVIKFGNPTYEELSGNYRLVKLSTILQKESGEFTMYSVCEMRRVPGSKIAGEKTTGGDTKTKDTKKTEQKK